MIGEVPEGWKKANVTPIFKDSPEDYRPVSLISIPERCCRKNPEAFCKHVKDKEVIGSCQCGFTKERSCMTNLIAFCSERNELVDEQSLFFILTLARYLTLSKCMKIGGQEDSNLTVLPGSENCDQKHEGR